MFFKFIPTSCTGILTTFGKFERTIKPGLQIYVPFIQNIKIISNRLYENSFKIEVKTKDNTFATLSVAVQYTILTENTEKAYYSLDDPSKQMKSYIDSSVRSVSSSMTLSDIFSSYDEIGHNVLSHLSNKMNQYGYTIENTLITEIEPDRKIKEALNKIEAEKRNKEAAKEEADAIYIKAVREAEADRDRKILQGEGISGQRHAIVNGYETSVDNLSKKFGIDAQTIIEFVMATQYMDALENIGKSDNTKVIFIPSGMDQCKQLMYALENKTKE